MRLLLLVLGLLAALGVADSAHADSCVPRSEVAGPAIARGGDVVSVAGVLRECGSGGGGGCKGESQPKERPLRSRYFEVVVEGVDSNRSPLGRKVATGVTGEDGRFEVSVQLLDTLSAGDAKLGIVVPEDTNGDFGSVGDEQFPHEEACGIGES